MRADLELAHDRLRAAETMFLRYRDRDAADVLLARFAAYWVQRNGSTAGPLDAALDRLEMDIQELIKRPRGIRK